MTYISPIDGAVLHVERDGHYHRIWWHATRHHTPLGYRLASGASYNRRGATDLELILADAAAATTLGVYADGKGYWWENSSRAHEALAYISHVLRRRLPRDCSQILSSQDCGGAKASIHQIV